MTIAVAGTSSMAWAWVVVLQLLGVNGLVLTTLRWSQNVFSMVHQCVQTFWERSTNFVCFENILILKFDGWNLDLQDRRIKDKHLHLYHVQAYIYENHDLARNDRESLWIFSWCISFSDYGPNDPFLSRVFPYLWPWGLPFLITYSGIDWRSNVYSMEPRLATFSFKRCPHVQ